MKIAVVGATGRTGLHVVELALADEQWQVVALVRSPDKLAHIKHDRFQVRQIDVMSTESLTAALEGCDALISCLGAPMSQAWPWCTVTMYTDTARTMVEAMREQSITRAVFVGAACSTYERSSPWIVEWLAKPLLIGRHLADMARMEAYFKEHCADIEYTVVKPPGLHDRPPKPDKKILAAEDKEFVTEGAMDISRASMARYMLDCLQHGLHAQKCVAIGMEK